MKQIIVKNINDDVYMDFKIFCINHSKSMSEILRESIERGAHEVKLSVQPTQKDLEIEVVLEDDAYEMNLGIDDEYMDLRIADIKLPTQPVRKMIPVQVVQVVPESVPEFWCRLCRSRCLFCLRRSRLCMCTGVSAGVGCIGCAGYTGVAAQESKI